MLFEICADGIGPELHRERRSIVDTLAAQQELMPGSLGRLLGRRFPIRGVPQCWRARLQLAASGELICIDLDERPRGLTSVLCTSCW